MRHRHAGIRRLDLAGPVSATASAAPGIGRDRYDALLLDLDGVVTDTAALHAACWKQMFDEFLRQRAEAFRPFDAMLDYTRHVDGKPRYDGVRDFLRSRGIGLPEGAPQDPPGAQTVCGLGNRKNDLVNAAIAAGEVRAYPGSVAFLHRARALGLRTAVVTSSQNRAAVLRAVGLQGAFDAAVDGNTIEERGLAGKPAPDAFLEAARLLAAAPRRAVVIEDAVSGVQAGRRGGFALVVGVDRRGDPRALREAGAHVVVRDLEELELEPGGPAAC
jgi:beta-phosphoglucomutase family hydrolase